MRLFLIALLILAMGAAPILADGNCYGRNRYTSAYGYQQQPYYYPPADYNGVEKVPFFYSVSDYGQQQVMLSMIQLLQAKIPALTVAGQPGGYQPGGYQQGVQQAPQQLPQQAPQPAVVPQQAPQPPPPVMPKADARGPKASRYQSAELLAVVTESCVRCHGPAKQDGGLALVTSDGKSLADLPEGVLWKGHSWVVSGAMPKQGNQIPDEKLRLFYDWASNARK